MNSFLRYWLHFKLALFFFLTIASNPYLQAQNLQPATDSLYRPLLHFSPPLHWINDPNGMVYWNGTYHLFYQHNPLASVWGPMHWGHATSTDLFHWTHKPIALYPDTLGTIFSGSAVVDSGNTSGLGAKGKIPLVAVFTHHDQKGEQDGRNNFQNQSLAYSLDDGKTWMKYKQNPVLKNPGIRDFRDPKVCWHQPSGKWIMTLAVKDRIHFYSSSDLKNWHLESEFGMNAGVHEGVWECPDLFPLSCQGKTIWVLIVNIGAGGPNAGSATQYFLGDFDGKRFIPHAKTSQWLDYGPDEYAGVTWSNTGERRIFIGWMSNWKYANQVPTYSWRNALTLPRELRLEKTVHGCRLASWPVQEMDKLKLQAMTRQQVTVTTPMGVGNAQGAIQFPFVMDLQTDSLIDFSLTLDNPAGDKLIIGYSQADSKFYIDRTLSGKTDFHPDFAARLVAPRLSNATGGSLTLVVDHSSVELFADKGLTVMTSLFFPRQPLARLRLQAPAPIRFREITYNPLGKNP